MARTLPTLLPDDLERRLLEKGISGLHAERPRCADCGRTPLAGEHVHRYAHDTAVCELCRQLRAQAPEWTELVHGPEHGFTVRRRVA